MKDFNSSPVILVADDDPAVRQSIKMMLAGQDVTAHYAEDGQSAYAQALALRPDLILLDLMMPGMDGFQVCRKLRENQDTQDIPIVMVTGLNDHDSRIKGIEAGADDFLTKPIDILALRARVNTILRLNRFQKLQKERAQFKWAVEQANEGYLLVDQGDHIVYANPKARSYLGLTIEEEFSNQVSFMKLTEKQFTRYPDYLWDDWRKPAKQPRYLMTPETNANRAFWLEVDIFPGRDEDPVSVISLRNVSTAVNAEQDFKKFHYLISHKLNTPLNAVYGVVELMNASVPEMSHEKMGELSQLALVSAERLRNDVQDILQYLRASAAAPTGETLKLVHVTAIASEIGKELKLKPIVVRVAAAVHNRSIVFSKVAFELILMELFENSKKFHPKHNPQIDIIISRIDEKMISIKIIDDGLHLSVEQRAAIVEPYQQADLKFTRETEGFGLGIPMVVTVLQSVGGRLNIYNSPDGPGLIVEMLVPAGLDPQY